MLDGEATALRYLNQTTYDPLRFRPSPIAIETKTAVAAETGESQLAVWTKAWRTRMSLLGATQIPAQPLVRVCDHAWMILFCWDEEVRIRRQDGKSEVRSNLVLMSELHIGDTRSILGVYKILKAMRLLAEWMEGDFYDWFKEQILR